jgi:hypothetical protein
MISVRINDQDFQLKSKLEEFTIGEFETFTGIINNPEFDEIEKYFEIFKFFGVSEEVLDEMETKEFFNIVREYGNKTAIQEEITNKINEITINGRSYKSFESGEEFKIKVKDMKLIESFIKKDSSKYIGELMAVIFKDTQLTNTEHYTDAHIKHKATLFRSNVKADIAIPYVAYFSQNIINSLTF